MRVVDAFVDLRTDQTAVVRTASKEWSLSSSDTVQTTAKVCLHTQTHRDPVTRGTAKVVLPLSLTEAVWTAAKLCVLTASHRKKII